MHPVTNLRSWFASLVKLARSHILYIFTAFAITALLLGAYELGVWMGLELQKENAPVAETEPVDPCMDTAVIDEGLDTYWDSDLNQRLDEGWSVVRRDTSEENIIWILERRCDHGDWW